MTANRDSGGHAGAAQAAAESDAVDESRAGTFRVRPAVADDLPGVIVLDERVTGLAKPDYWRDLFERFTARQRRQRFFLVAEAEAKPKETRPKGAPRIVGFITGEVRAWEFGSPPCGWVFALSVDPEARLDGAGSALLEAISGGFREAGIDKMRTMLSRDNHLLMSFFRSRGMMAGPYIQLETELD